MTDIEANVSDSLRLGCESMGISITQSQRDLLMRYLACLLKWNVSYNLSAIRSPSDMLYKHLLDSLSIVPLMSERSFDRVIDVGTGAGLPGIPLAICLPKCNFTLLDSAGKKTRFLMHLKHVLGLPNVQIENKRVENFDVVGGFDVVISRAFASLNNMVSWCSHLVADEGEFWAMKGVFPQSELSALKKTYKVDSCSTLHVPGDIGERCLVIVKPTACSR